MAGKSELEYLLVYYVSQIISGGRVCIAAVDLDPDLENVPGLFVATHWEAVVQSFDPDADLVMLRALLREIDGRLRSPAERHEMLQQLEDSFSNTLQVSTRLKCELAQGVTQEDFLDALLNRFYRKASD